MITEVHVMVETCIARLFPVTSLDDDDYNDDGHHHDNDHDDNGTDHNRNKCI